MPLDKMSRTFRQLPLSCDGTYRPARVCLQEALAEGKLKNPLVMQQSIVSSSSCRPTSAARVSRPPSRARSVSHTRQSGPTYDSKVTAVNGLTARDCISSLKPQRIEVPSYLNTPKRRPDGNPVPPEQRTQTIRKIQDLELLTFACRRARKVREEGRAHFSLGVHYDNLNMHQKAISVYNQFLRVCKECNDQQGCALAYHCIAVDYQLLGANNFVDTEKVDPQETPPSNVAADGAECHKDEPATRSRQFEKAIFYHNKHRELSDSVGKFIAHLNIGLVYSLLGEKEASTVNHQYALRYALQLRSLEGQSLAIGGLGFSAGMYENDPEKMRLLIERYIELCETLNQPRNKATALKKLGIIANQQGDNEQSINYFQQAIERARAQGDQEAEKDCSVRIGIAAGQARMEKHLSSILKQPTMIESQMRGDLFANSEQV